MREVIEFHALNRESVILDESHGRNFKCHKRLKWLRRPLRWLYLKLSVPRTESFIKRVSIQTNSVREAIFAQRQSAKMICVDGCRKVVIGPRQAGMLKDEVYASSFEFPVKALIGCGGRTQIYGLDVVICPWFDGVLVLPNTNKRSL